ncbi:MAG: STAS domain-containing protein [Chloroflexi bacterium]|nr:STAS domain-containing protein [Chloroflexota bacterium]
MEINSYTHDHIYVLQMSGRFDAVSAQEVLDWLDSHLDVRPACLVVNLGLVSFMDSLALAVMVKAMKHCREQDGNLHLCCLNPSVQILFELTRLDRAFDIFATEEEAINAFTVLHPDM